MEAQTDSTSFQFRTPGITRTKTDAQVAYGFRFGCSLYGWKDNFKTLRMALVSDPNSSEVDRNHLRNLTSSFCPGAATPSFSLWALYRVGAHYGHVQGVLHDPREFISSRHTLVRVWVLLKLFCQEQFTARSVCKTPNRVLNHSSAESLQLSCVLSSSCLCSSLHLHGLALVARSTGL